MEEQRGHGEAHGQKPKEHDGDPQADMVNAILAIREQLEADSKESTARDNRRYKLEISALIVATVYALITFGLWLNSCEQNDLTRQDFWEGHRASMSFVKTDAPQPNELMNTSVVDLIFWFKNTGGGYAAKGVRVTKLQTFRISTDEKTCIQTAPLSLPGGPGSARIVGAGQDWNFRVEVGSVQLLAGDKIRIEASIDYIAGIDAGGKPHADSLPFCEKMVPDPITGMLRWVGCLGEIRPPSCNYTPIPRTTLPPR